MDRVLIFILIFIAVMLTWIMKDMMFISANVKKIRVIIQQIDNNNR